MQVELETAKLRCRSGSALLKLLGLRILPCVAGCKKEDRWPGNLYSLQA
jgi:hypothetical protein